MVAKKILVFIYLCFFTCVSLAQQQQQESSRFSSQPINPEAAMSEIQKIANQIDISIIRKAATQQNGRIKPFDTLAREHILFLNGRYSRLKVHPVQLYLALVISNSSPWVELIEIRDPELRKALGYLETKRFYSLADLEPSPLASLAQPLIQKQQENVRLSEKEKKIVESYEQMMILQHIITGQHLQQSIDFSMLLKSEEKSPEHATKVKASLSSYLTAISENNLAKANSAAENLVSLSVNQKAPELFLHYIHSINAEVLYNDLQLFLWSALLYVFLGSLMLWRKFQDKVSHKIIVALLLLPLALQIFAISLRVYITEFAPVTNMYGTMIWVALGINMFSIILFGLYKNRMVPGFLLITSGLILWLTESIPMVLSPDLDPLVAVLRNNFWLSTHVTTITISYAAFAIAMVLGNVALIRLWTHSDNSAFFKEYGHYCYRMIQLGVFLITAGIILGGVWADYSWGRFWGWDPKETWALIADLGFIALLHARYIKWVNDFTLLALSPLAFLLVVMAWYGVNFILAAGLHSYGFSSGGATAVALFVVIQVIILAAGLLNAKNQS